MKARCSGWSFSIVPSPSSVVIAPFAAADTGTEQERADLPSISTVHAPHWASPQPNFGAFSSRSLRVNGATRKVSAVAPDTPLLYVLRNDLELNAPKFGCGLAQCGACTVLIDGKSARSCSVPVSAAANGAITTLEGLGTIEKLHPLQRAFIE